MVEEAVMVAVAVAVAARQTCAFVLSIIWRPYAVTVDEISRQGSWPTCAPVKPYTELADTLRASWRPS